MDESIKSRDEKPRMRDRGSLGWRLECQQWVVWGDTAEQAYAGWRACALPEDDADEFFEST